MSTISLTTMACPACGAQLEDIQGQEQVTCGYCSTSVKILQPKAINIDSHKKSFKSADLDKFKNISSIIESSMKAGNYTEAYDYCNKALELNPKIGEVWENKAICSFWKSVSFIGRDEIVYSNAREIVTLLNSSKEHDADSKTYEAASDGIGFNLGQITMAKIEAMMPDVGTEQEPAWSAGLVNRMTDYLNTMEVAFQIMSNKDTEFLKYIITEYSGANKMIWLEKNKDGNYEPQNIFKKREMLIKKVQEIEPDYVPPKIEEPKKYPWWSYVILFVVVFIVSYATSSAGL